MALQITLVKTPGNISVARTSQTFNGQGGTLGRAERNTWVLPDPEKFLSSCHCEIKCEAGAYYLVDLSTNGTFLNGSHEPLGKGNGAPLKDGDFFEIGDFRFSAKLTSDQSFASTPFAPQSSSSMEIDSIFGASSGGDSLFADPFASAPIPDDFSLSPDVQNNDPLFMLDNARKSTSADPFAGGDLYGHNNFDQGHFGKSNPAAFGGDIFSDPLHGGSSHASSQHSTVDSSFGLDQSISWPNAAQENVIPDDWEDDLLSSPPIRPQAPVRPTQPAFQQPQVQQPHAQQPFQQPAYQQPPVQSQPFAQAQQPSSLFDSAPDFDQPMNPHAIMPQSIPSQPVHKPAPYDIDSLPSRPNAAQNPTAQFAQAHNSVATAHNPVTTAPVAPVQMPAAQPVPQAPAAVDHRLIAAMGLDASRLTPEQMNEISDVAGELMREIVDGMMQVLRSRTSIKNEFRMNVTTIQPVENNPLKFSVGVDDALENLFLKKTNAYKKPIDAFREGFQEIGEHQVAMIAGIRHGFDRMMERFNPEKLRIIFDKQGKGGVLPGMQKAKYWTSYSEHYQGYVDNMDSSFQHLFGSDFVLAYEDQMRKLIAARKKNK